MDSDPFLPNLCLPFTPSCWKKSGHHFLYFLPNSWAIGFFSVLKDFGNTRIFPESQFCSNVQNVAKSFKVCINCLLFTPLDYKLQQNLLPVHYSLPPLLCTIYFLSSFISLLSLLFFLFSFTSLPLQKKL